MTQLARRAELTVTYNGRDISAELAASLVSMTYTDAASGSLDDLQIKLEDRDQRWQGDWSPAEGDTIVARIKTINWLGPNKFEYLPFGTFEVDSFNLVGPPDQVAIGSLSLPAGTGVRREKNTRSWEKVTLKSIAADIAKRSKLKLLYEFNENPTYERLDQNDQADLPFLLEQCQQEGVAVKVAHGNLILFDERKYEQQKEAFTIYRNNDDDRSRITPTSYSFSWSTTDQAYRACQMTYRDSNSDTNVQVTYTPPGAPRTGPLLKINGEGASSQAEALRIARNRLREKNKNYGKASLSLPGDVRMVTSLTLLLAGWGRFDAKYIIENAVHTIDSNGYATRIELRKVLGW